MIAVLREEMNKIPYIYENINSRRKWIKQFKVWKLEIESTKKTQAEGNLEMKIRELEQEPQRASLTNRMQEMEKRISGIEGMTEEMDMSDVQQEKVPAIKHPRNLGHLI